LRLVFVPLTLIAVVAAIGLLTRDESPAASSPPPAQLVEIARFDEPVYVTSPAGDARLFVVERSGRIWVVAGGRRLARPFLDLSSRVSVQGVEEGLLSMAFAPDYASSGLVYVDYTDRRGRTVIAEFRRSADPDRADPGTARTVLVIRNRTRGHHGGLLLFGPDGLMYVGQGDGGKPRGNYPAQRLDNLSGKILRIDPRRSGDRPYRIPRENPYVGRPGRDEIWVHGLRNPWRFGFDASTGALVIGDVGRLSSEEIDIAPEAGMNFGWSCYEGTSSFAFEQSEPSSCDEAVPPAIELVRGAAPRERPDEPATVSRGRPAVDAWLEPGDPVCSVVTGVVVQDPALPGLAGRHLYGDFCDSSLHGFRVEGGQAVDVRPLGLDVVLLSSFGTDSSGRVYATSLTGPVYRLDAP
jgi:Glucose / Sorbosone dehydrogenase